MNDRLVTQSEIGTVLGVSRGQVHMWDKRRARNSFPQPVTLIPRGHGTRPVYKLSEVLEWHKTYKPSKGGRPTASK